LRGDSTNLIGLAVREISDPFFADLIELLNEQAKEENYNVVLGHVHSDPDEALKLTRVLDTRHVDGVIFLGDSRNDEEALRTIVRENVHAVALCRGRQATMIPTVNCDNEVGIQMLMEHLCSLGHRRLMFIDGGWLGDIRERRRVFLNYQCDEELSLSWIQAERNDAFGGYAAMVELLSIVPRPTAVVASDDIMAIGALKAAHEAGLRVPEDISLAGFDDIILGRFSCPSLTTVRQPIELMGRKAIQLLLELIEGHEIPKEDLLTEITPELVVRESTGPPPTL
jgi:DNA-binding LacI/PurR family transcriptional regulator